MFADRRDQLSQLWNKEVFSSVDQDFLMCEIVDPSTSRSAQVACVTAIKNERGNRKKGYEGQIEGPYPVGKLQRIVGYIQINDQIHSQVIMEEAPNKKQE